MTARILEALSSNEREIGEEEDGWHHPEQRDADGGDAWRHDGEVVQRPQDAQVVVGRQSQQMRDGDDDAGLTQSLEHECAAHAERVFQQTVHGQPHTHVQ